MTTIDPQKLFEEMCEARGPEFIKQCQERFNVYMKEFAECDRVTTRFSYGLQLVDENMLLGSCFFGPMDGNQKWMLYLHTEIGPDGYERSHVYLNGTKAPETWIDRHQIAWLLVGLMSGMI
jgi:hypothetical protein